METIQKADTRKTTNLVKKYLKETFGIAASVRTESYSGGSSMRIEYVLGPDSAKIEQFAKQLQYGHFNGMEDIYEHDHTKAPVIDGYELEQFKFVFVKQVIPKEFEKELQDMAESFCNFDEPNYIRNNWYRYFEKKNFVTQNMEDIALVGVTFDNERKFNFEYEVNGVKYFTQDEVEVQSKPVRQTGQVATETVSGIQVVDYSDKAFALVGENTKLIKDDLKQLGGKFNFRLSCGAGWIFSKSKMDEVMKLLTHPVVVTAQVEDEHPNDLYNTLKRIIEQEVSYDVRKDETTGADEAARKIKLFIENGFKIIS